MVATYHKYVLEFKKPSGTSRGILRQKETWFIVLSHDGKKGIGECGILRGLSVDDRPDYEAKLHWVCNHIDLGLDRLLQELIEFPSIQFGLEIAFRSLASENPFLLYKSSFTDSKDPISINGLIWMGDKKSMKDQIEDKLQNGFDCIKMKIGAIDFDTELDLLSYIRSQFPKNEIEIRVDANGAFTPEDALHKLKRLSQFEIHSIEQPIKQKQYQKMAELCDKTPLPIALDEELIGVFDIAEKEKLLTLIKPQYIILKPSLVGGIKGTQEWIALAKKFGIGWWITSALESNIGLNAIAQFTYTLQSDMPQGLGTGSLYTNNFESPLTVTNGTLLYDKSKAWKVEYIN
ncbi:o-succinylbenzoate synthase [Aquimarina algicola]|uniref:O-succinylbenzoate synthase n=1 Tax=Aquimarina algicola TaxID=2589995 RepID=A0A504JCL5_9FLAO|nr:o-succinylbenzoate synthase [Aquimarina algicola]TPN88716.1 o-succinylbenzoate synthase [Aquimarina algicola]